MLIIGLHLLSYTLHLNGYWEVYPHLVGLTVPFPLLYGPMLFLYVSHSLKDKRRLDKSDYVHFIPAALSYLYLFRFFFFYSADEKRLVDAGEINDFDLFTTVLLISIVVSGLFYSISAFKHLNVHKQLIDSNFSNEQGVTLGWLKNIIRGIGLFFVVVSAVIVAREFLSIDVGFDLDYIFYAMLVLGILLVGYFGIRHQNIFTDNTIYVPEKDVNTEYKTSGLTEERAEEIHEKLIQFMKEEKPYHEPKLTLTSLATELDVSPNYLSQVINQYQRQNFNEFINEYRISDFIRRANANRQLTLLAHALDVGFNSKSTFNLVFKRHRGVTPTQFMANAQKMLTEKASIE
jgi:AraC-like DNA-binding protein